MSGERTEKPSEQRKNKSRGKGEGVRSRELSSAASMLGALLVLHASSLQFLRDWAGIYRKALATGMRSYVENDSLARELPALLLAGAASTGVIMLAALTGAVAVGAMQNGGVQIHAAALRWKPARLNPVTNLRSMFSTRSLLRLLKSLVPAAAVVALASWLLTDSVLPMPVQSYARLPRTLSAAYDLALKTAWISVVWSLLDYVNEWWQWNSGLKMSRQDVKEEMRESNGDPQVKSRMQGLRRAMRRRRVRADVAKSTVVITNPTHYAVALLFDYQHMGAPTVLAKGRDLHALEMRDQARWAGVPIVENPPLARSLYRSVQEGQAIPVELYAAVAGILAYLYREAQARTGRSRQANARSSYGYTGRPVARSLDAAPDPPNAEPSRKTE